MGEHQVLKEKRKGGGHFFVLLGSSVVEREKAPQKIDMYLKEKNRKERKI